MKKIFSLFLVLLVAMSLVACTNEPSPGGNGNENGDKKEFKVLLATNLSGDKSFADSAHLGAKKAEKDFGITVDISESADPAEYESQILNGAEGGYDVVISGDSGRLDYIEKHAANYPDVKFGITDILADKDIPNILSVIYAQNQGSFLAGAAAAMFTEMTEFDGVNSDAIIGWVGGEDIPALRDFFIGYEAGAKYINPDIKILQSFAGHWTDPLKGKELTLAMYEQGADIVMNVASMTGNGVLEAAKDAGKYAIGVDLDQDGEQPGHILTSMLKENGEGVYQIIKAAYEAETMDDFGGSIYMDLSYGGVNLTDMSTMKDIANDEQKAKLEEILKVIDELKEKIGSGELEVPNYTGFGPDA